MFTYNCLTFACTMKFDTIKGYYMFINNNDNNIIDKTIIIGNCKNSFIKSKTFANLFIKKKFNIDKVKLNNIIVKKLCQAFYYNYYYSYYYNK